MEQPQSFRKHKVCKLLKPLYGLKQSGREWYKKLDKYVTSQGARRTEADPCVHIFGANNDKVIMISYVDDIILASKDKNKLNEVKYKLKSKFEMTDLGPISNILGIKIERNGGTGSMNLSQENYTKELIYRFNM